MHSVHAAERARSPVYPEPALKAPSGHVAAQPIHVLIVGDQAMVRAGLAVLLSGYGMQVSECTMAELRAMVTRWCPDVTVVLSRENPLTTLALLPQGLDICRDTAILLLSGEHDPQVDRQAVALGVRGVLTFDQPPMLLAKAIEKVHEGELWLERSRATGLMRSVPTSGSGDLGARIASLTRRELEIVHLVGQGLRNHEIAGRLFISQATVRNHLTSVLGKLDLCDRFDLAVFAFRNRLVRFP
jgi:DNA-binding NarL/FixJ family response regulator